MALWHAAPMPSRLARTLIRACYQHARHLSSAASQQAAEATFPGHVFQQRITPAVCSSLHANVGVPGLPLRCNTIMCGLALITPLLLIPRRALRCWTMCCRLLRH